MNKILLIIGREYFSRVKKKSFIVMTLLTPLLIAAFYGIMIYFSVKGISGTTNTIAVINQNKHLTEQLTGNGNRTYKYLDAPLADVKKEVNKSTYDYVLVIPEFELSKPAGVQLLGKKQAGIALNSQIERDLEELIRIQKLKASGITQNDLDQLKTSIDIDNKKLSDAGEEEDSSAGASAVLAYVAGIMMFMFIMLYGIQVMRGVIEEKTSRIIEVMISSVKPFQLMMGKIIGIALVGLTQFILWIVLTTAISTLAVKAFVDKEDLQEISSTSVQSKEVSAAQAAATDQSTFSKIQKNMAGLELGKIVTVFLFFFVGGYLFYSALYAAIGSAVDNETETQQFMFPVMMPLLLGYVLSLSVVTNDPYGPIAFWLSIIPFTSPIAMMVRMPYGVPDWQLALSMVLLILGFIGTVWVAARVYRVGILMYGKKVSFKEMVKWFTYKN